MTLSMSGHSVRPLPRKLGPAILCVLLLLVAPAARADTAQDEIDRDVWRPFMTASNAFDADGFIAVQSKDLVRVAVDTKEVYGLERYAREIRDGFKRARERGLKRKSEARFLSRASSADLAYETGYFKSEATLASGEERVRYSRFEFVLRKENGVWKILVDKDTADGVKITEQDFQAASPVSSDAPRR
jgi:ketosteroid isomerase-like protein